MIWPTYMSFGMRNYAQQFGMSFLNDNQVVKYQKKVWDKQIW